MRVWITREEEPDGPFARALFAVGLTVAYEPVLERRVVDDCASVLSQLGPDDWIVLTSPFAIQAVAPTSAKVPKVAVVGEPSRRAAAARGFRVELVSARGGGEGLFEELRERCTSGTVCYPRSSLAKPPPPWSSVQILSPVLYETVSRRFDRSVSHRVDIVSVASPSAVEAIGPVKLPFASIGPTTSTALRRIGIEPSVEAPESSFEALAAAIAGYADSSPCRRT